MREILKGRLNQRFGYVGWCLMVQGATKPLTWTFSTTREEVRQIRRELEEKHPEQHDAFEKHKRLQLVRVNIELIPLGVRP
mgnify:CR=1 FL=1